MDVRSSLAEARRRQDALLHHQATAVQSAKEEAASVKAAQEEVARQLARVNELEKSLHS